MQATDPALVGLCLDSGHATYGGGSPLDLLERHRERIWHVHFKDCEPEVAARARQEAVGLSDGAAARRYSASWARARSISRRCCATLERSGYDGWIVVEQDVLPAMGAPLASATRNRQYLREIGLQEPIPLIRSHKVKCELPGLVGSAAGSSTRHP